MAAKVDPEAPEHAGRPGQIGRDLTNIAAPQWLQCRDL
jgi:hypothetical protein